MIAILAAIALMGQNTKDTYGKTNEQILAMGYNAWSDFYNAKAGVSTIAMSNAAGLYGDALMARNDRLMKRLKPTESARFKRLRTSMLDFKNEAIGMGVSLTGGGTMWNPIAAGMQVDTETALYRVLAGLTSKAPRRVVSDVTKVMAQLKGDLGKAKLDMNWPKVAKDSIAGTDKAFDSIVKEAKGLPRRDSDTILEFCRKILVDIRETATPK
ncbi:hypothetical protein EON81_16280 [bacterium]|nr:MAG: hypothetical protein EON81_16280 [bacterium]